MILFPWQKKKRRQSQPDPVLPRKLGCRAAAMQGQGQREYQEDAFALLNHQDVKSQQQMGILAVVADGMGGMRGGSLASETAVSGICNSFSRQAPLEDPSLWLKEQFLETSAQIHTLLEGQGGSTMICCLLREDKLFFASVGDSFLYLYRDGQLNRLNRMQTVLHREFMEQIQSGSADPAPAREHPQTQALTGFLGMEGLADVDVLLSPLPMLDGDSLLICSDGVGGVLEESDLIYCLRQGKPEEVCEAIRQRVLGKAMPYQDNFTALVIQCVM